MQKMNHNGHGSDREKTAKKEFGITPIGSDDFERWATECVNIYGGNPCWLSLDDDIDTVNFAKAVCSETARLAMLALKITLTGSARAQWLHEQIDKNVYFLLREWVEYACAYGTVILKPHTNGVDLYTPDNFMVTEARSGKITGVVFFDTVKDSRPEGDQWYTKMEYHHFTDDGLYSIENRCFVGSSPRFLSRPVDISWSPWVGLSETVTISDCPTLYAVLRTPQANNIDIGSPLGLPIFSEAVQELRDLDIAYSRFTKETYDSKRIVLLDSDSMLMGGDTSTKISPYALEMQRKRMKLPDMVRNVQGNGTEAYYKEINPELNTETRVAGINMLLNQIGYKCGFSNGHFVFNERSGIQTATQVEADQQRTIQFIKDVRDKVESCISDLCNALNAFADLYNLAPSGSFKIEDAVHFADITYSFEADKLQHYQMAVQGHYPWEEYYVRFLKYSREEARELLRMAKAENKAPTLFGGYE